MKKVLLGFIAISVILIGTILIGPSLINWNSYKAEIAGQIKKITGRELTIGGDLHVSIFP